MPDIPLLEPVVLQGVVEKLTAPENLTLLNQVPRTPWPFPSVVWDVIKGSRQVAKPNVPNSEAHIVSRLGVAQETATFVYLREKKVFEPTTIHWIRQPGQLAARNAEAAVLREVTDLNQRFDNFAEFFLWQMLSGTITYNYADVQATVNYSIPASHLPSTAVSWASATPAQIRNDIQVFKRLISRDARVQATDAFSTEFTLNRVMNAFASNPLFLSDRQRDTFYSTGTLPGFLGLNWNITEQVYDAPNGHRTLFVPDDTLIIANLTDGRPIELYEGASADDEAPDNFTGKFSKTWKEKDPSSRIFLLEWSLLPVLTRPEQVVYVSTVTGSAGTSDIGTGAPY